MAEDTFENEYELSIRLLSDDYDFGKDIEMFNNYNIKTRKKEENIIKNSYDSNFKARNIMVINNIYGKQIKDINIDDSYVKLNELLSIIYKKYRNNSNIICEFYITYMIENQQFGFEIDQKLVNILSKYGFSIIISGIAFS